jgi:hypothetical protein
MGAKEDQPDRKHDRRDGDAERHISDAPAVTEGYVLGDLRDGWSIRQWRAPSSPPPSRARVAGGERRLDVIEFVVIARAIGADPVRILRSLTAKMG